MTQGLRALGGDVWRSRVRCSCFVLPSRQAVWMRPLRQAVWLSSLGAALLWGCGGSLLTGSWQTGSSWLTGQEHPALVACGSAHKNAWAGLPTTGRRPQKLTQRTECVF